MTIHVFLIHWFLYLSVFDVDSEKFTMEDKSKYTDFILHSTLKRIVIEVESVNMLP